MRIIYFRDTCTSLNLQHCSGHDSVECKRKRIAYALSSAAHHSREISSRSWRRAVRASATCARALSVDDVVVAVPTPSKVWFDLTYRSSQMARAETARWCRVLSEMAVATTMGGGWASVKHAGNALMWALQLMDLAGQIGDESTMRKCRVFVGWALMWSGAHESSKGVFQVQGHISREASDDVNHRRCVAALLHHEHLLGQQTSGRSHQDLGEAWISAFAIAASA